MKLHEMGKKVIFIQLHSVIDLITNSSTELFVVDGNKAEGILKEILEFMIEQSLNGSLETEIVTLENYKYKDDYIIPEGLNEKQVYAITVDYHDVFLNKFIDKYFTLITLEGKDD